MIAYVAILHYTAFTIQAVSLNTPSIYKTSLFSAINI